MLAFPWQVTCTDWQLYCWDHSGYPDEAHNVAVGAWLLLDIVPVSTSPYTLLALPVGFFLVRHLNLRACQISGSLPDGLSAMRNLLYVTCLHELDGY